MSAPAWIWNQVARQLLDVARLGRQASQRFILAWRQCSVTLWQLRHGTTLGARLATCHARLLQAAAGARLSERHVEGV